MSESVPDTVSSKKKKKWNLMLLPKRLTKIKKEERYISPEKQKQIINGLRLI